MELLDTSRSRRAALAAGLGAALGLLAAPHLRGEAPSSGTGAGPPPSPLADPRVRLAHLMRRAGFGVTPEELDRLEAIGYEAAVDRLLEYDREPDPVEERLASLDLDLTKPEDLKRWWIVRMVDTARPLQEKMVLFWHGFLTSALSKVNNPAWMLQQNRLFRSHALGNFRELLLDVSKDPAMLVWLDGRGSRKEHPNENYARELMELFTLGEGHYTEQDVREAARAFTGWMLGREGEVRFNPGAHDGGEKTVLGRTGRFNGDGVVEILVAERATGEYLGRRLFSFFAYPDPATETVSALAGTYFSSGYSIKAMVRQILLSPEFSSPRAYRSLVRTPVDLVVSSHRMLGLATDGRGLPGVLRELGQDLFSPPSPAGWPGGPAWLNSSTWLSRVNFANAVATRRGGGDLPGLDLKAMAERLSIADPRDLVLHLQQHLVDGHLAPEARKVLEEFLFGEDPLTLQTRSLNREGRTLVYALLASPEFQVM